MKLLGLLAPLGVFGAYTLAVILLTGPGFVWNENRRRFYLAGRSAGLWASVATFGATWMSAASLLGYPESFFRDGMVAFGGAVNGWLLGLLPLPWIVAALRRSWALSLPEWIGKTFDDPRLRHLTAAALLLAYVLYILIQFRSFGGAVSHLLGIRYAVGASALVYLFVLYTTFGGMPSVIRSDVLNFWLIVVGVTVAAVVAVGRVGGVEVLVRRLATEAPELLNPAAPWEVLGGMAAMTLGWGLGVAANPQYAVRILSARSPRVALGMLAIVPFFLGVIYLGLTAFAATGRLVAAPVLRQGGEAAFLHMVSTVLPPVPASLFLVALIAAAVSTANSQLLLAASSFCYDLMDRWRTTLPEDIFLFRNRLAVTVIATLALGGSLLPFPDILTVGRFSWTVVALCFFLPLFWPLSGRRQGLFEAMGLSLVLHGVLVFGLHLPPEGSLLPSLLLERLSWRWFSRKREEA